MALISVIVPIYNAEKTLVNCLSNLVHQTFEDIELILVNDCSKDDSLNILLECERQFPEKVLVIDVPENHGAGGARNIGLSYASGDYIGFVDSDDRVDVTMFEKLYKTMIEEDCDIVECGYYYEEDDKVTLQFGDNVCGMLDAKKKSEMMTNPGYLMTNLYKRSLWDGMEFREHTILEDLETLMKVYLRAQKLGKVGEVLYFYRNNQSSLSKEMNPSKYHNAVVDACNAIKELIFPMDEYANIQKAVEYIVFNICKSDLVMTYKYENEYSKNNREEILQIIKNMVSIPPKENEFICQRMNREDFEWMMKMCYR